MRDWVIAEPDLNQTDLTPDDTHLIIACDGVIFIDNFNLFILYSYGMLFLIKRQWISSEEITPLKSLLISCSNMLLHTRQRTTFPLSY